MKNCIKNPFLFYLLYLFINLYLFNLIKLIMWFYKVLSLLETDSIKFIAKWHKKRLNILKYLTKTFQG